MQKRSWRKHVANNSPKYKRILLKLSGEALMGEEDLLLLGEEAASKVTESDRVGDDAPHV